MERDPIIDTFEEFATEYAVDWKDVEENLACWRQSYEEFTAQVIGNLTVKPQSLIEEEEAYDYKKQVLHFIQHGAPEDVVDRNIKRAWRDRKECQGMKIIGASGID